MLVYEDIQEKYSNPIGIGLGRCAFRPQSNLIALQRGGFPLSRVPSGGVTLKRRCTYRPSVIYLIVNKFLSLSLYLSLYLYVSLSPPPPPSLSLSLVRIFSADPHLFENLVNFIIILFLPPLFALRPFALPLLPLSSVTCSYSLLLSSSSSSSSSSSAVSEQLLPL